MNKEKILKYFYVLISLVLVIWCFYFVFSKKINNSNVSPTPTTTPTPTTVTKVEYKNTTYGFSFSLPQSWKGYSVVEDVWEGYRPDDTTGQVLVSSGPLIFIRHPLWTEDNERQDIPVLVFTISQWNDLQSDKFHIGAAPIGPSEIARNSKYVFGLPARYNFSYLKGFEEVEEILKNNPIKSF